MSYRSITKEVALAHLNGLVDEWRNQFENPPEEVPVTFAVNETGMICANGIVLFRLDKLNLNTMGYELEYLYVSSDDGDEYEFGINWPVAEPPYLSYVKKTNTLYTAP